MKRITLLVAIMTIVATGVGVAALAVLYETAFEQQRQRLVETAKSQARLMEAVARFDHTYNRNYPQGAGAATIEQIRDAHANYAGIGDTGEFTLARRDGDVIKFLLRHRHSHLDTPAPAPFHSNLAEPMRRALSGQSGTVVGLDYRGVTVLAAYEPVAVLDLGIVAKIDLADIRAPFLRAFGVVVTLAITLIACGTMLFYRLSNPMIRRIRDSEERYRAVAEDTPVLICRFLPSSEIVYVNESYCRYFGKTSEALVGSSFLSLILEDSRETVMADIMALTPDSPTKSHERQVVAPNGEIRWQRWTSRALFDPSAQAVVYQSVGEDITERKQAERALEESQSLFAQFMDHLPAAVFIKAPQGHIFHANAYLRTHFGSEDAQGNSSGGDFPVAVVEQLSCDDRMVLAEGWYELVEKLKDHAGQERTFRIHNFAIPRLDGEETLIGGIAWDITDTVLASEALRNSERRYREIFELAQEGIWLIDAVAHTVDVNMRMAEMLGYTVDEMLERPVFDFMDEEAREEAEVFLERRRQSIAEKFDFRFRTKAGADCWAIVSTAPMYDAQGVYAGAMRMVTDITDRKRSEEAVRAQEEKLRLILASTGEGIFGLDMDGCCTFANRACIELLGFGKEKDLLGKKMHELIHHTRHDGSNYPAEECPTYRSCTLRHVTFADDELLWRADGSAFHAEYQSYPMLRDDEVVGAVVSFADITEHKQAEAVIRQERDFAERLIETAPVIVLVLDPEGRIIRFNSLLERLSGYSLAEVRGKSWFDTFPVERGVCQISDVLSRIRDEGSAIGALHAIVTRDGKERLITWYNTTLRDPNGEVTALLAIGHDVTEQKAKDVQLHQAQKMEMVGQLTGGIAHDFNNLLTVIIGNLELLIKSIGSELNSDVDDLLEDSLSAARDGAELTHRLLAYSRKNPLRKKRIDLSAFLSRSQRFLRRTLGADIAIELDVEAHLDKLHCDPHQLESALLNLALNARDAMPGGGRVCLQAKAKQAAYLDPTLNPGEYIEIAVIDTGVGMTPDQLTRAIEPFYTTKGSKQGSGLGLSMVFGFCEQAGGRFLLASKPGVGTRASILLPLNDESDQETESTIEPKPQAVALKGIVLVVEDEVRVRKLAGRFLKDLGYEVLMAENGEQAIEILQSDSAVDLVFSDVVMPGKIDGVDLYRWAGEQRPELKVLLTTGLRSAEITELSQDGESRVPMALRKPYTKAQLAEAIQDVIAI